MFHWGKGSSFSGYAQDWKSNNELLGLKSQELVDGFACQVIKCFRKDQRESKDRSGAFGEVLGISRMCSNGSGLVSERSPRHGHLGYNCSYATASRGNDAVYMARE
jgi:hypothetical protein